MMKTFPEQLLAARKASGMTQEQLAEQISVSRPMISHWETGRSLPDLETIRRLSRCLNFNFLQDDVPEPLVEEEVPPAQEDNVQQPKRKRRYLYAFLGGIAVAVVVMCLILLPERPQENPDAVLTSAQAEATATRTWAGSDVASSTLDVNPIEWYQQPNERIEGQAYLSMAVNENPLRALPANRHVSNIVGWDFVCEIQEENGFDFTVTEYSVAFFFEGMKEYIYRYDAEVVADWWGDNIIPAHGMKNTSSSFPMDGRHRIGVGLMLIGIDANGNEREFHYYIELSQEIAE